MWQGLFMVSGGFSVVAGVTQLSPGQPCVTVPAENQRAGAADTTALGMSVLGPLHPQLPRALPCPPGTFPALEGGVSLGDSGLSPRWGPEPLWNLCCAQEVIPCHWQHFPSLRLYPSHTCPPLPAQSSCTVSSALLQSVHGGALPCQWELLALRPFTALCESRGCHGNFCQQDKAYEAVSTFMA